MTIFTDGLRAEPENRGVTDYAASFGESLGATVRETVSDLPTSQALGLNELNAAKAGEAPMPETDILGSALGFDRGSTAPAPTIDKFEAADRVKAAGLHQALKLPDQDSFAVPALDIMINRARDRRERETTIQRGPQGILPTATSVGTSFLVGALDPLNVASAFIPVVGELRYGKLLAGAGESFAARTGVRLGIGGAEGVVGQAVLEPLDWYAHTQDGRDFGMADVLHNLVFGAALGGGLHSVGGGVRDIYRARKGLAQYPFGPGEPLEHVDGTHVPASVLAEEGVAHAEMPAHLQPVMATIDSVLAESPALHILRDLPPPAHEDSMRAALANIVEGEPVKVGELLQAAAQTDPRIAESFEAWHGSPHAFDRFDLSKLGSGEGAQAYGHGLYFAENEKVARSYQRATSDKAFVNKVSELYDEGFSPDDAWGEIKDNFKDFSPAEQRLMKALEKDDWLGFDYPHQAVSAALRDIKAFDVSPETAAAAAAVGNMYKVRIKADHEHFLDWDKPIDQQSPHVKAALKKIFDPTMPGQAHAPIEDMLGMHGRSGKDTYQSLVKYRPGDGGGTTSAGIRLSDLDATPQQASRRLQEAGIAGIKYLDQGSRGGSRDAGAGTRNFVVFDDKHIEITHKNGEPVNRPVPVLGDMDPAKAVTAAKHGLPDDLGQTRQPQLHGLSAEARNWPEPPQGARVIRQGDHGPELDGLQGRWPEAVDWLSKAQSGDARGVLAHPDVPGGRIDVVWGNHAYGLEHIMARHPEVIPDLPERIAGMRLDRVTQAGKPGERLVLAAPDGSATAVVRTGYDGEKKIWLLTAYTPESDARGRGEGTTGSPSDRPAQSPASPGTNIRGESGAGNAEAFRDLAATRSEVDDPRIVEASRAAEHLPEPVETAIDKRVSAAEHADAYAKQMYDMFKDRLPAEERQRLDDLITSIDDAAAVRKEAIERSGACLFGARA